MFRDSWCVSKPLIVSYWVFQPSGAALPLSLDAAMTMGEEQYDNIPDVGEKIAVEIIKHEFSCKWFFYLSFFILYLLDNFYLFLKTTMTSVPTLSPPP